MIPTISCDYGVNLDSRMLDIILYVVGKSERPSYYYSFFMALLIDRYNDLLPPLLRQFHLLPDKINMSKDIIAN